MDIKISEKILPNFYDMWRECKNPNRLNIVCKGGRNSSKSTTISIRLIFNRMKYNSHALVIRKIDKTLRRSCREQLIWAINHLQVNQYWEYSQTPTGDMTLTYIPTQTKIFFEGANNPEKIKSYKTSDKPITDLWYEELAEFKTEEEIQVINNSILRAGLPDGLYYKFFYSYNPPKRKQSWLNKKYESAIIPDHTYVHHSTYLDNPYVSNFFKMEAEHIKQVNKRLYDWDYLGMPIGSGVVPFNNLQFRKITDEEIQTFDNIRQGNDWGYATDPNAFVRWHYDKTRRTIYAIDEIYQVKMSNRELADILTNKGYNKTQTIADSAEPKSIDELKQYGCYFIGAKKGQGSVEYGEKWLDELEAIVIDPNRTPNIAMEFENIDYMTDKDGNTIPRLEDKNNHIIDGTRYAFQNDMDNKESIIFA
jgi:PBSX family phage terminase large subunit